MNHMAFINQANSCEFFEIKQNYRIQSSSSHILYKSVYPAPQMLGTDDINFKVQVEIRLQVQGFDYQHNSRSKKIISINCTAKMVNTKICRMSTLHEG